ncbi:MAG: ABC transporter permease [Bradymonadia bacterium]
MRQVYAVALNTFREAIRSRVLYSIILFVIGLMLLILAAGAASLNQDVRLVKDVGMFLSSTFAVVISIFIGGSLVYKEIERKTIFTIAPKPIWRWQFLVGKYCGVMATMAVQVIIMGAAFVGLLTLTEGVWGVEILQAFWLVYVEVAVITAVALLFSSFSTPALSGVMTFGVFMAGRFADELVRVQFDRRAGESLESTFTEQFLRGLGHVVPDLSLYNTTPYLVYDQALPQGYTLQATIYGLTYALVALMLAAALFSRRDFT